MSERNKHVENSSIPRVGATGPPCVEFTLIEEEGRYVVAMRATVTPAGDAQTLSGQVTIKVPHAEGPDRFVVTDLQPAVESAIWVESGRTDAPSEDPQVDYISFAFNAVVVDSQMVQALRSANAASAITPRANDLSAYAWQAGVAIPVFSFANGGDGQGEGTVALLADNDPFLAPNSAGTNPINQIAILGIDTENAYLGNYNTAATDIYLPLINR